MAGEPIIPAAPAPAQGALPLEPAAAAAPAAAPPAAEPAAAAAPAPAPEPAAAAAAPASAKVELTGDKPSLLDFDDKAKPAEDKKPAEPVKAKPADDKPAPAVAKPDDKAAKPAEKPAEAAKPAEPAKDAAKPDDKAATAAAEAQKAKDAEAKLAADRADIAKVASELKFELPEQLKSTKTDDPIYTGFIGAVAEATKNPQTAGQTLLKLHTDAMEQYAQKVVGDQHKAFNDTRDGWRTEVMADEDIGGSGHQTSMKAIARMRDMLVPEKDRPAFNQFLRITGAGDHPQFLKMLHRAARFYDEPGLPPENPKPPADNGRPNGRGSKVLYDHPRSPSNRNQ